MNRFFTAAELADVYRLPKHVQEQLLSKVAAVETNDLGEPLFLEAHVDAWLADQYAAVPGRRAAEDSIKSWSRVGDLVFNPFAGAGTALRMSLLNHRRYLGLEINPKYVGIARRRLQQAESDLRVRQDR